MTMTKKRADSIISCFESTTHCGWTTERHEWELKPWGSTMFLACKNIENDTDLYTTWLVRSVYLGFHGRLDIETEEGLVLAFALGEEGP